MFDFNKEYLYHSVYSYKRANLSLRNLNFENVLKSGYILSRRNLFKENCEIIPCGFNSNDYISLSKKVNNNPDINKILNTDITKLSYKELFTMIVLIDELQKHPEAYYQYAILHPTFIFNTNIGEIKTTLINDNNWKKYINDENQRYSDLIGEYQIKNSIDINKAVAIALPYYINIFRWQLQKQIAYNYDISIPINEIKKLTLEKINIIEQYLPNTPIVDISSKKILTKTMFNDII